MKSLLKYSYWVVVFLFLCSCSGVKETDKVEGDSVGTKSVKLTEVEYLKDNHDFGKIEEGVKVVHVFTLKNIGDEDLVISRVQPSCGCTVPKWSKEPIKKGELGEIEVVFDSQGREGSQHKSVTVVTNTKPSTKIHTFTAEVIKKQ